MLSSRPVDESAVNSRAAALVNRAPDLLVLALSVAAVAVAAGSLRWRFQHDSPLLLYIAYATDQLHLVPYRDIFDFNAPGSYAVYRAIGAVSNYTDPGVRICEIALLTLTAALSWVWMKQMDRRAAVAGAALWILAYLGLGPRDSLQREFILMPAILLALVVHDGLSESGGFSRVLAGALWGLVATIKPHAAIGFALVGIVDWARHRRDSGAAWRSTLIPSLLGFGVPLLGTLFYLSTIGALGSFTDIVVNYWPLYAHLSGEHEPLSALQRIPYIVDHLRSLSGSDTLPLLLVAAVLGAFVGLQTTAAQTESRNRVKLLIAFAVCYWFYPAFSGTFWPYHWIPCTYFVAQLMALCVGEHVRSMAAAGRAFCAGVLCWTVISALPLGLFARTVAGRSLAPPNEGRVDQIASYLKEHLREGDTVQPLDWTGGAVHAMLLARARIATPFLYDFYFYYDVSNDYVEGLRRRFIERLRENKPRFIIDVREHKAWIRGPDTSTVFTALQSELETRYRPVHLGTGFIIYESCEGAGRATEAPSDTHSHCRAAGR